jgi:hypothetical protein
MIRLTEIITSSFSTFGSLRSRRCWLTTVSMTRRAADAVRAAIQELKAGKPSR